MLLNRQQAADLLGISKAVFCRLEREGRAIPVNDRTPGGVRFNARFDATDMRALKRALAGTSTNGHAHPVAPVAPPEPTAPDTPLWVVLELAKLDAAKRDLLLRLGQRYSVAELTLLLDL